MIFAYELENRAPYSIYTDKHLHTYRIAFIVCTGMGINVVLSYTTEIAI